MELSEYPFDGLEEQYHRIEVLNAPDAVECNGYKTNKTIYPRCLVNCINCPYQEHHKQ